MTLKEKVELGLKEAISSRGKNKGMLKAKCPQVDTYGAAVWNALMTYSNPYKVGLVHMLLMSKEKKEVYDYIITVGKTVDLSTFDNDGNILRKLNLF